MPVSDENRSNARRRYREAHAQEIRAYNRRWVAENRERHNAHSRKSAARKRVLEHKRERQRRYWANRTPEQREHDRRRLRAFHEQHPEKSREYRDRWRAKNPERAREVSRRSASAWRDRNAEQERVRNRETAAQRRADDPEINRRYYQANLERERERGRESSRQRARLKKAGLPPRTIHKTYAAEKRANQRAAEEFFSTARDSRVLFEAEPGHGADVRIASTRRAHQGFLARREEDAILARLPQLLAVHHAKHGARIREEVRLDNVARAHQGQELHDLDAESNRRMLHRVLTQVAPEADRSSLVRRMQEIEAAGERLEKSQQDRQINSEEYPTGEARARTPRSAGDELKASTRLDALRASIDTHRDGAEQLARDAAAARAASEAAHAPRTAREQVQPQEPAPQHAPLQRRGPQL